MGLQGMKRLFAHKPGGVFRGKDFYPGNNLAVLYNPEVCPGIPDTEYRDPVAGTVFVFANLPPYDGSIAQWAVGFPPVIMRHIETA